MWERNGERIITLMTADAKKTKDGKKLYHLLQARRKCGVNIRVNLVTHSVERTALNFATAFQKNWLSWYNAKGVCAQGKNTCICGICASEKCSRIKIRVVFLSFQTFLLMCEINIK